MGAETVFVGYSDNSAEHKDRVLELSNALRAKGVDVESIAIVSAPSTAGRTGVRSGSSENAKYVLMICTPTYRDRVENRAPADEGRGVFWEGSVIYNYIYDDKSNTRFVPVLLGDEADTSIPNSVEGLCEILRAQLRSDEHAREAVDLLRRSGNQDHLPRGLLTRALWRAATGDFDGAREDLDEAFEIAERGPMRLYLADIHLHGARLFGLIANQPDLPLGLGARRSRQGAEAPRRMRLRPAARGVK